MISQKSVDCDRLIGGSDGCCFSNGYTQGHGDDQNSWTFFSWEAYKHLRANTPAFEKLAAIQTLDVWLPTTDGRYLVMPRYTEPEADVALLLHQLKLILPKQPLPRLVAAPVALTPQLKM